VIGVRVEVRVRVIGVRVEVRVRVIGVRVEVRVRVIGVRVEVRVRVSARGGRRRSACPGMASRRGARWGWRR
jgi:hypothetical protein